MSELFKSKLGRWLAGIHLLIILTCLLYVILINNQNVIATIILMILTAPWGLLLMFLPAQFGILVPEMASHDQDLFFIVIMAIGGLINAFILYLLGFLLTKAFNYLSSKKQSLS